jgi:hypothetical protein
MRGDAPTIRLRFSPAAWKKLHAALNSGARRQVPALVEEYFRVRGWTVVQFHPVYVGLSPYRVGRLELLLRPQGEKPWNEQPVYAVVCRYSNDGDGIVACVYLAELPRNAEQPKPLTSVAQSLVKRLSNVLRSLPAEHLNEEGSQTGAGACAEMPLHPNGSGHEAGSRQDAPSESPAGDSDGADNPPPQDGRSGGESCANRGARGNSPPSNPASSGSGSEGKAWEPPEPCADEKTADTMDAPADATPSTEEATSGDAPMSPEGDREEATRESSTVPSAGVAYAENAAVRQSRRNLLRDYARRTAQPSTQSRRAFGGQFETIVNKRPDPRLVREIRRLFAQIMQGGETEPSAHWDAARVALKTAGYLRSWTTHDRRLESGRPAMLVLADVSGSMNAFAEAVVALASAAAQLGVSGADVVVVVHANGYPLELQVNAQQVQRLPDMDDDSVLRFYEQLLRRYAVRVVITAADWDGAWLYHWLAEQPSIERVFWLDVYCSSYGDPRVREFPPRWMNESDAAEWRPVAHKVRYADRCSTQHDFVDALRLLMRGQKRRQAGQSE